MLLRHGLDDGDTMSMPAYSTTHLVTAEELPHVEAPGRPTMQRRSFLISGAMAVAAIRVGFRGAHGAGVSPQRGDALVWDAMGELRYPDQSWRTIRFIRNFGNPCLFL